MRSCYRVAILMMNDPKFRKKLFNTNVTASQLGVVQKDLDIMRRLDVRKIDVLATDPVGKRIQNIEAEFPRTVATLRHYYPLLLETHLYKSEYSSQSEDRKNFVETLYHSRPLSSKDRRFLYDLCRIEQAKASMEGTWMNPERLSGQGQVRQSPQAVRVKIQGPLQGRLGPGAATLPTSYSESPCDCVVVRRGESLLVVRIGDTNQSIWDFCKVPSKVGEIVSIFGHGTRETIQEWLDYGVLDAL